MATHSSTLAWKIPWMEEPGGLHSTGSLRVGSDWATSLSLSRNGEGNGNPLQCSCLENPRDGRAWWAAVYGVAQSRTRLKRLSSNSSSNLKHPCPGWLFLQDFMHSWPMASVWAKLLDKQRLSVTQQVLFSLDVQSLISYQHESYLGQWKIIFHFHFSQL